MASYRKDNEMSYAYHCNGQHLLLRHGSQKVGREIEDGLRRHGEAPFRKILRKEGQLEWCTQSGQYSMPVEESRHP